MFLDFLAELPVDAPRVIVDVKYNHLTRAFRDNTALPDFLRRHGVRVLNLTRHNFLRYYVSNEKGVRRQMWHETSATPAVDAPIAIDVDALLKKLPQWQAENAAVSSCFTGYDRYLTFDYAEMTTDLNGPLSEPVLRRIAEWLDVAPDFEAQASFTKQARLPLAESIVNFAAVADALRGTDFEYCLADEPFYERTS